MSVSAPAEGCAGPAEAISPETKAADAVHSRTEQDVKAGLHGELAPVLGKQNAPAALESTRDGLEGVDPAIADALKAPKNRQTVLRFEEDVLTFIASGEDALFFPLSLSGYQRLLAHRTAQYHGLQTATVDDGGEDHGKIKATKPQPKLEPKPRLADIKVPEPGLEQKEPAKPKKRGSDRQPRKDRDAADGGRGSQRSYLDRVQEQRRAQERMLGMAGFHFQGPFGPMLPPTFPQGRSYSGFGGPNFVGSPSDSGRGGPKQGDDQRLDLSSSRSRSFSSSNDEELRRRPSFSHSVAEEGFPGAAADVERGMGSLSLHPTGEQPGLMHPGMAVPPAGYSAIPVPFAYVPTAAGMPQPVPHLQGVGMYGSPPVPFAGFPAHVPYGYMPGRQQMVGPVLGQPMGAGMMPYYPGFIPQGYGVPGVSPPVQIPQQGGGYSRGVPQHSPGMASPGSRRPSVPADRHQRQDAGSPSSSTARSQKRGLASLASFESSTGDRPSP